MDRKYVEAVCCLAEMLLDMKKEIAWKSTQVEMRDKELEKLKIRVEYLEGFIAENVSNG